MTISGGGGEGRVESDVQTKLPDTGPPFQLPSLLSTFCGPLSAAPCPPWPHPNASAPPSQTPAEVSPSVGRGGTPAVSGTLCVLWGVGGKSKSL